MSTGAASTRVKWTESELQEIQQYLHENLKAQITPGRKEVERALEKSKKNHGDIHKRHWETVKKKVWNLIKKNK